MNRLRIALPSTRMCEWLSVWTDFHLHVNRVVFTLFFDAMTYNSKKVIQYDMEPFHASLGVHKRLLKTYNTWLEHEKVFQISNFIAKKVRRIYEKVLRSN